MKNENAIVLFSGGLDSTTLLCYVLKMNYNVIPITFSYGQRHSIEIEKAAMTLKKYGLGFKNIIFEINLRSFSNCSLLNNSLEIPQLPSSQIPSTYVPARNLIFLSIATGFAELLNVSKIFIGVNAIDYSGYPDCRPEFIENFNQTISVGTKAGLEKSISVEAPLINLSKKEIIELGLSIGVDYSFTHSCYNPSINGFSCGICDSCRLRLEGFKQAGIKDPLDYINKL